MTRQFVSRDPAKWDGAQSSYQYCGGNPVLTTDPAGERAFAGDGYTDPGGAWHKRYIAALKKTDTEATYNGWLWNRMYGNGSLSAPSLLGNNAVTTASAVAGRKAVSMAAGADMPGPGTPTTPEPNRQATIFLAGITGAAGLGAGGAALGAVGLGYYASVYGPAAAKLAYDVLGDPGAPASASTKVGIGALEQLLADAKPIKGSGHPWQVMTTLQDGSRVIFRADVGPKARNPGGPFAKQGALGHFNIEVHSSGGKQLENLHVVPDGKGGYAWWGLDKIVKSGKVPE